MGSKNYSLVLGASVASMVLVSCGETTEAVDDFPNGTIEIVVGYDAGGSSDINARALANQATETCDTNFVITNQPGASATIALDAVAGANPDGYTLLHTPTEMSATEHLGLTDITHEDFAPVMLFVRDPHGIYVGADSDFESINDIIAAAEGGESFGVGTSGPASTHAFTFNDVARGADIEGQLYNVPFTGVSEAIPAVISGEVDILVSDVSIVTAEVEAGDLVPLAVITDERFEDMPDVPTLEEEGIEAQGDSIYGLAAPADTPSEVIDYLDGCFREALESEDYQEFLSNQNSRADYMNAEEFSDYLSDEYDRYEDLVDILDLDD